MKLLEEYRVPLLGVAVAAATLAIGSLARPVHAAGCKTTACTFQDGGTGYDGTCGANPQGSCVCSYNGQSQTQSACNS